MARSGTTPLIIQQQQSLPKVMVQQIQPSQQPAIQQIITSVAPQTSTPTVVVTQIVTQATQQSLQSVTKMAVPAAATGTQQPRVSTPVTLTTVTVSGAAGLITPQTIASQAIITPTVTLTPTQSTLVKHVQEVVVSPQKSLPLQSGITQQVKTVPQGATVRQIQGTAATLGQLASSAQTVQVQHLTQAQAGALAGALVKTPQAPPNVQQAVQQVVQQAQAQANQRHQQAAAVAAAGLSSATASTPSSTPGTTAGTSSSSSGGTPQQVILTTQTGGEQDAKTTSTATAAAYTMRLRNQRS